MAFNEPPERVFYDPQYCSEGDCMDCDYPMFTEGDKGDIPYVRADLVGQAVYQAGCDGLGRGLRHLHRYGMVPSSGRNQHEVPEDVRKACAAAKRLSGLKGSTEAGRATIRRIVRWIEEGR